MEFETAGQVFHPQPGEELLIPARAVHSARNIGTTTARWLYGYGSSVCSMPDQPRTIAPGLNDDTVRIPGWPDPARASRLGAAAAR
jgi:hypothetical protein